MKKTLFLVSLIVAGCLAGIAAPQKQKVYSLVKQYQTLAWYQEQLALWEKETTDNPKNAEAWLNVYSAARMIKLLNGPKTKADLDALVEQVKKNIPGTFEGYYIPYWNGNNEAELSQYLFKAYELAPDRPETYDDLVTYYELRRDKVKEKEFCEKWLASNDISQGLYAWNYNLLMSCEKNGILITHGDNDTYPALVLQYAKNIRPDVTVLNDFLILKKEYRDLYFKELGIPAFAAAPTDSDPQKLMQAICSHIRQNSNRPFYYANTVDPAVYADVNDDLHCVGLAFRYSKTGIDKIALLRKNYEKLFLTDYLRLELGNDVSRGVVANMNCSYLMPFLILHKHYKAAGETEADERLLQLINDIAAKSGRSEEVTKIIREE